MPRPVAIMACGTRFDSAIRVGSQCLALAVADAGWDVGYISNPVSPFHLLALTDPEVRCRIGHWLRGPRWRNRICHLVPAALAVPRNAFLLRSPWLARHWQHLSIPPRPAPTLSRLGLAPCDVLYIDSPLLAYLATTIPHRRLVYRMSDVLTAFPSVPASLAAVEEELVRRADLIAVTSEPLAKRAQAMGGRKILPFPNAVDPERFRVAVPIPKEYGSIPAPRAVFVGSMAEWFDHDLIIGLARSRPGLSIVLIGPCHQRKLLSALSNVHVLGSKPPDQIPAYLRHAQVGLIPFSNTRCYELVDSVDPIKLYEYLAAGLPVVATRWRAISSLNAPAVHFADHDEFAKVVDQALSGTMDPHAISQFLAKRTWNIRWQELLSALQ